MTSAGSTVAERHWCTRPEVSIHPPSKSLRVHFLPRTRQGGMRRRRMLGAEPPQEMR